MQKPVAKVEEDEGLLKKLLEDSSLQEAFNKWWTEQGRGLITFDDTLTVDQLKDLGITSA